MLSKINTNVDTMEVQVSDKLTSKYSEIYGANIKEF